MNNVKRSTKHILKDNGELSIAKIFLNEVANPGSV